MEHLNATAIISYRFESVSLYIPPPFGQSSQCCKYTTLQSALLPMLTCQLTSCCSFN